MLISLWSWYLVSLFNWQYSYQLKHFPIQYDHINITASGNLLTCIYPTDKSFKKGSSTFARSELRSLYEPPGNLPYKFGTDIKALPNGTDYSVWQVFGNGSPLLMLRHRKGEKQMVVFDGSPKIQTVREFPKECLVDCRAGKVSCGEYISSGSLKCNESMYFKIGVYAQQVKPKTKMCIEYGSTYYFKL